MNSSTAASDTSTTSASCTTSHTTTTTTTTKYTSSTRNRGSCFRFQAILTWPKSHPISTPARPPCHINQDHGHDMGYIMDSYTPMTSANTTPATTPGSTPPSGSDCHHYRGPGGGSNGKSPSMVSGNVFVLVRFFFVMVRCLVSCRCFL